MTETNRTRRGLLTVDELEALPEDPQPSPEGIRERNLAWFDKASRVITLNDRHDCGKPDLDLTASGYRIPMAEMADYNGFLKWLLHLREKNWFTPAVLFDFLSEFKRAQNTPEEPAAPEVPAPSGDPTTADHDAMLIARAIRALLRWDRRSPGVRCVWPSQSESKVDRDAEGATVTLRGDGNTLCRYRWGKRHNTLTRLKK